MNKIQSNGKLLTNSNDGNIYVAVLDDKPGEGLTRYLYCYYCDEEWILAWGQEFAKYSKNYLSAEIIEMVMEHAKAKHEELFALATLRDNLVVPYVDMRPNWIQDIRETSYRRIYGGLPTLKKIKKKKKKTTRRTK